MQKSKDSLKTCFEKVNIRYNIVPTLLVSTEWTSRSQGDPNTGSQMVGQPALDYWEWLVPTLLVSTEWTSRSQGDPNTGSQMVEQPALDYWEWLVLVSAELPRNQHLLGTGGRDSE